MPSAGVNLQVANDQESQAEAGSKRKGAAGGGGHFYEIKLSMLFYLRLPKTDEFYLKSNLENAGAFDDVVFQYKFNDDDDILRTKTVFLQAKHGDVSGKPISLQNLLAPTGAFSLKKYFESYQKIKRNFNVTNEKLFNGNFQDCNFVIFTNYQLEPFPTDVNGMSKNTHDPKHIRHPDRWNPKEADGIVIAEGNESRQLNVDEEINKDIIESIRISPVELLVKKIHDYTVGNMIRHVIELKEVIFMEYHIFLANEVFRVNEKNPKKSKLRNDIHRLGSHWQKLHDSVNCSKKSPKKEFEEVTIKLCPNFGNRELKLDAQNFENLVTELANIIGQSKMKIVEVAIPSDDIKQLANNVLVKDDSSDDQK